MAKTRFSTNKFSFGLFDNNFPFLSLIFYFLKYCRSDNSVYLYWSWHSSCYLCVAGHLLSKVKFTVQENGN